MVQTSQYQDLAGHPDIAEMQQRYERIGSSGQAVVIDGLVLLAGAWLAISPWVVGFSASAPNLTVNDLILGIAIGVIALGLAMAPGRMFRLSWAMTAIGVWVVISPWIVQRGTTGPTIGTIVSNVVAGAVTVLLGLGAVGMLMSAHRQTGFNRGIGRRGQQERGGYERGGYDRGGYDRGGYDRGGDRPAGDRPGYDRPGYDRATSDRPGYDRLGTEQRPGFDQPGGERAGSDADRPGTERRPR
ncbi:SPW repeat domain-containing protein [Dactylosporangium sp. CA-139114]|uniref:SPW repeat protein n=1 Tax=Dactylosporangium sp. CA-139114 TaxID=3239931 RepID=UPI003D95117A